MNDNKNLGSPIRLLSQISRSICQSVLLVFIVDTMIVHSNGKAREFKLCYRDDLGVKGQFQISLSVRL